MLLKQNLFFLQYAVYLLVVFTVLSAINDDPHILVNFSFLICMGYFIYYIIDMYILKRNVDDSIVQFLGDIFINYNSYKKYLK